jgi:hypothetical protein
MSSTLVVTYERAIIFIILPRRRRRQRTAQVLSTERTDNCPAVTNAPSNPQISVRYRFFITRFMDANKNVLIFCSRGIHNERSRMCLQAK